MDSCGRCRQRPGQVCTRCADAEAKNTDLAEAVMLWVRTPGRHGGNPYSHRFVALAERQLGEGAKAPEIADKEGRR